MSIRANSYQPTLSFIVATARNHVMGNKGGLPWYISSDLQFFKATTMGKPVLMGRKTWESLPFPLPGRPNLVLTRNDSYVSPSAEIYTNVREFVGRGYELAGALGVYEVMVIGGAHIFKALMPLCSRLYVTEVQAEVKGDTYFPVVSPAQWALVKESNIQQGPKDDYPYRIKVYQRNSSIS